jgi:predicted phage-related endonuclease
MAKRKNSKTQNELDTFKKELLHELHLFHIRVSEELKKLSKALSELENTLDRYHQKVRLAMKDSFGQVMHAVDTIGSAFDTSREELERSE